MPNASRYRMKTTIPAGGADAECMDCGRRAAPVGVYQCAECMERERQEERDERSRAGVL